MPFQAEAAEVAAAGNGSMSMASRWQGLQQQQRRLPRRGRPLGKPLERDMLELIKFKLKYIVWRRPTDEETPKEEDEEEEGGVR